MLKFFQAVWKDTGKQRIWFFGIIGLIFGLMLVLNILTPLIADDYYYAMVFGTKTHLGSIGDIIRSQILHYENWGGRSIVHGIVQLFLWLGKPVFNIFNALVYVYMTLLLLLFATGYQKLSLWIYILINVAIWEFSPVFGQTSLWLVGSCNYLWGMAIILTFLLPYRLYSEKQFSFSKWFYSPVMLILGVLAGWCNENTSFAALIFAVLTMIIMRWQKIKLPLWTFTGVIGCLFGFFMMVAAPGNFLRAQQFASDASFVDTFSSRFLICIGKLGNNFIFLMLILIISFVILYYQRVQKLIVSFAAIPAFCALMACGVMIASPIFPERATFGVMIFFIMACGACLVQFNKDWMKEFIAICAVFSLMPFIIQVEPAFKDIEQLMHQDKVRKAMIQEQILQNKLDVVVPALYVNTKFTALYGLDDIDKSPDDWVNTVIANYYNLNSIAADEIK